MSIVLDGTTGLAGAATGALNGTLGATTPSTVAATTGSFSGVATFSAGSATAPAITTSGDTNTGEWFPAADTIAWTTGGTERIRVDSSGNLLLGSSTPVIAGTSATIQVTSPNTIIPFSCVNSNLPTKKWKFGAEGSGGAFIVFTDGNTGVYLTYGNTSWTATSDERLKTNLIPIEDAIEKVAKLRSVTGRFKTDDEGVSRAFLIAQDVQAVLPEAVSMQNDEQGTLGIQYTDVIPLLVSAINELNTKFEEYKASHP